MSLHERRLDEKFAAAPGAEGAPPSCFSDREHGPFLEFRPEAQKRVGFPWAQLCHYTFEPNSDDAAAPERLTLAFSTADVVVVGARLGKLSADLVVQNPGSLQDYIERVMYEHSTMEA